VRFQKGSSDFFSFERLKDFDDLTKKYKTQKEQGDENPI